MIAHFDAVGRTLAGGMLHLGPVAVQLGGMARLWPADRPEVVAALAAGGSR